MLGVRMTDAELGRLNKVARKEGIAGATLARALILAGLDDLEGKT
jgi:predicted DNA-binding protein